MSKCIWYLNKFSFECIPGNHSMECTYFMLELEISFCYITKLCTAYVYTGVSEKLFKENWISVHRKSEFD